jgi:hypothetical protein
MKHLSCKDSFAWLDVLEVVQRNPELKKINENIVHKTLHDVDTRIGKSEES